MAQESAKSILTSNGSNRSAGAMENFVVTVQAVEHAIKTINALRSFSRIQTSCDSLQKEMEELAYQTLKPASQGKYGPPCEFSNNPVWPQLLQVVEELDLLLRSCVNHSKRNSNRARWTLAKAKLDRIRLQVRKVNSTLQPSILSDVMRQSVTRIQENLQAMEYLRLTIPESSRNPFSSQNLEGVQGIFTDHDANVINPTLISGKETSLRLDGRQSETSQVVAITAHSCSQECRCRCHGGLQQHPTTTRLRSLLGPWIGSTIALSVLHKPECSEKNCIRMDGHGFKFQYWLLAWLGFGTVFIRGSYGSLLGLEMSMSFSKILELSSVEGWIGNPKLLKKHLERGFNCFPQDRIDTGNLLLEWMIYQRYFASVRLLVNIWRIDSLLSLGGLPRQIGYAVNWTLAEDNALNEDQIDLLQYLKLFLDPAESDRTNGIHDAVVRFREDDDDALRVALFEQPWEMNDFDHTGRAPIHLAIQYNRVQALNHLIERGVDVNKRDSQNRTPIQLATLYGRFECLWILLESEKCLVDEENDWSKTALQLAAEAGSAKAVAMLVGAGASAVQRSRRGSTALHLLPMAKIDHPVAEEIVHLLRRKQVDLNARDENGNTPALVALARNNLPVLKALFEAGASLHVTNRYSQNILHFAALYSDVSVLEYLTGLELEGIHPELRDRFGNTPEELMGQADDGRLTLTPWHSKLTTQGAFTRLLIGVSSRNLQSDLNTLNQLLQAAQQHDLATCCVKLSIFISWKETCSMHDHVNWYRGILGFVEEERWKLAIDYIQSDMNDTDSELKSAQSALDRFVDLLDTNEDPARESDRETCSSDDDSLSANEFQEPSNQSRTQQVDMGLKDATSDTNNVTNPQRTPPRQNLGAAHQLSSTADDPTALNFQVLEPKARLIKDSGDHRDDRLGINDWTETGLSVTMTDPGFSYTMPELVDSVFRRIMPISEPPVPLGRTRVRWKCICGDNMFDDFTEVKPGSLNTLRYRHSEMNRTHDSNQQRSSSKPQMLISVSSTVGAWVVHGIMRLVRKGDQAANIIPVHTSTSQNPRHSLPPQNQEVLHLLLCIDKGECLTRLHQDRLQGITGDKELFSFLRNRYFEHRKFTSWFALRSVKNVSLARFRVDANYVAGVHGHDVACSSECICLPPLVRIESEEYRCAPAPKVELGYFPAIGSRELLHYFKKPHDFEIMQRIYLNQIPKRACGQLRASQDEAELGWGLHFEEGWHWRTIYFITVVLVAITGISFGVIWSVTKGDIQSAFAVSGAWMTLGPLMLGYMAIRDA